MSNDIVSQNLRFLSCSLSHDINGSNAVWLRTSEPQLADNTASIRKYSIFNILQCVAKEIAEEKNIADSEICYCFLLLPRSCPFAVCGLKSWGSISTDRIQEQQCDKGQKCRSEGHELSWIYCNGQHQEMQYAGRIPEWGMCYGMHCCAVCCRKLWRQLCFVLKLLLRGITKCYPAKRAHVNDRQLSESWEGKRKECQNWNTLVWAEGKWSNQKNLFITLKQQQQPTNWCNK